MKSYSDLVLFGKVVSTALLVVGYILLGYYIGRKFIENGYPSWTQISLMLLGAVVGAHQMFLVMREMIRKIKK
jgi:surface polysaccharide O-acyltransferase-like enzyme